MPAPTQALTFTPFGGTPGRLSDAFGNPVPTTGFGSVVFSDGATLRNVTLIGTVIVTDEDQIFSGTVTLENGLIIQVGPVVLPGRTMISGGTLVMADGDCEVLVNKAVGSPS